MTESSTPAEAIPCPTCAVAPTTVTHAVGVEDDDDDAVTHCEWCGAEYPMPHHPGSSASDPEASGPAPE